MNDFELMLIEEAAKMMNITFNEVIDDFKKFSAEIDRVKEERNLSEDEAIAYVGLRWKFPFAPTTED